MHPVATGALLAITLTLSGAAVAAEKAKVVDVSSKDSSRVLATISLIRSRASFKRPSRIDI